MPTEQSNQPNQVVNFSTSSLTEYQRCPREWYWGHGYRRGELVECVCRQSVGVISNGQLIPSSECPRCGGTGQIALRGGIESTSGKLPLAIGSGVHKGIEVLFNDWNSGPVDPNDPPLWIAEAEATYDTELGDFNRDSFEYLEGFHMVWALVRTFERVYLPSLLQNYEVLLAERMIKMPWSDGFVDRVKCDAVLRSKQTGKIVILSIKTAASLSQEDIDAHSISSQGNNEILATEYWARQQGITEPVERYRMLFLLKGQQRKETQIVDGQERILFKYHDNPILHPWFQKGPMVEMNRYTGTYKWTCTQEHEHKWAKGGICPGYKNHTLGKDWERLVDPGIWGNEHIGVEGMIDYLSEYEPQVLGGMIVSPFEHTRDQQSMRSWEVQTKWQLREQEKNLSDLTSLTRLSIKADIDNLDEALQDHLDVTFRQHLHSCYRFRSPCPFLRICHPDPLTGARLDPEDKERFRLRMEDPEDEETENGETEVI